MKYVWKVVIQNPESEDGVEMHGVAANVNIAISKAKKKYKETHNMKSESDDLTVLSAERLYTVEF